ncbi:MAG: hypothetical protein E8A46_08465 [Bradyrhizobium sp.]|jgi:hypothetical protein|uniref:hypothetical protein n=1 Tax=Bradyrhizobium sp. TaxID=376 RepID=UPI001219B592|nr:hypothetical protein [Bradyrhizobium sp.]THD54463.1 MAG: hypothetical protein E8A46_08465 [Bradyrhizobium sp.]
MALHRDIYWVGRQWAVTGYGIQACDQKQKGQFDIEAARLWDDGVQESVRALKWFNTEDFDKAVSVARKYYPEPPRKAPLAAPPVSPVKDDVAPSESPQTAAPPDTPVSQTKDDVPPPQPPKPVVRKFEMRNRAVRAKFLRVWRIRSRASGR